MKTDVGVREQVWGALDEVRDPCMVAAGHDVSIVDLGLVYDVEIEDDEVEIFLTFTEPGCMFSHRILAAIYDAVEAVPGVASLRVTPQWTPMWTEDRMNRRARSALSEGRSRLTSIKKIARQPAS